MFFCLFYQQENFMFKIVFIVLCLASAFLPLFSADDKAETKAPQNFVWPTRFEGKELKELELSARELKFSKNFPGEIKRFSDGQREILVRWIKSPNRKVHPSSDCFKGFGFQITAQPLHQDSHSNLWGCFIASKDDEQLLVREIIYDANQQNFSDVSAWYWSAVMAKSEGPWIAYTVAQKIK